MEFPNIKNFPRFSYDTEDTGLRYKVDRVFGFSISTPDGNDYYWDIRETPEAVRWLNEEIRHYNGTIVCHNASFDYRMSNHTGIFLPIDRLDDTVIRACCIDEHVQLYSLDFLCKKYMGKNKVEVYPALAELFGGMATKNVQMPNLHRAPSELVKIYASSGYWNGEWVEGDSRLTLDLWEWQEKEIERQGIERICDFERHKMPTFIRSEMAGIRVNLEYIEEAANKLTPVIEEYQTELNKLAGQEVNANSSPQVKKLYEPRQDDKTGEWFTNTGHKIGSTKKGGPSLDAETLRGMAGDQVADLILAIRSITKTRDTFLRGHVLGHAIGDRVYPTINQSKGEEGGTGTGRLSYQSPAMQQIPSRNKKVAAIVKPGFLPDEGQVWVDGDMNQFEVRVFAHLVNNPIIVAQYKANPLIEFHQFVADLTGLPRNATYSGQPNAKQLNLSMIFNSGKGAIADKMGMEWEWNSFETKDGEIVTYKKAGAEAEAVIEMYHQRIKGVKELADKAAKVAASRGYVFTNVGRRLRFPNGHKAYKASGLLIQATSADINKENWVIIEEELKGHGRLMLNTHDSYSMSLPEDWEPHYKRVKDRIEEKGRLRVPLILDLNGVGNNWWESLQGSK